jgi:hypothetical protein
MGNSVRYRLGAGGLIGVSIMALAALPGCSTGQAADEFVATDGFHISAPAEPPLVESGSTDLADPQAPLFQTAQETAPKTDPFAPPPEGRVPPVTEDLPILPVAPALEAIAESSPAKPGTRSADERIQRLEERFDALLNELRESKNPAVPMLPDASQNRDPNSAKAPKPFVAGVRPGKPGDFKVSQQYTKDFAKRAHRSDGDTEQVSLTRATYKLPAGRAQAIAAFLTQNLTDEIEVRVKGDGLQVTASEDDQTAIGHFIRLLQTRGTAEPKSSTPQNNPTSGDNFKPADPKGF